ncbi:hypothetical protein KAH85_03820 [Candidatus Bathyarchaeota archaeon]|nr:hypothetical protein [Candidatus Bathyarchaeota archaeon]MCK5631666.1 hypothetical protein [Candidatus Bathyarchaeota archaeon]
MQYLKCPETYVLKGEEAVGALEAYIAELKEKKPDELTETQAGAMVRLAEGLISAIDGEAAASGETELSEKLTFKCALGDLFSVLKGVASQPAPAGPQRPTRDETYYHPSPTRIM